MLSAWGTVAGCLGAALGMMVLVWMLSLVFCDASLVDPFWGLGFVLIAWVSRVISSSDAPRVLLLCLLVTTWGLRLSVFLLWRNFGADEDRRYAAMRAYHGKNFWWVSLITVFLLQGGVLWFIALPVQIAAVSTSQAALNAWDVLGCMLWSVGLFFEVVGDWQLAQFKSNGANRTQVMDRGLWRYTRHPNYFGDFCVWWGIYLIAATGGAWWTIGSPIVMSILLMRISGVPLLESTISERRPDYLSYRKRTSAFFPWPPSRPS